MADDDHHGEVHQGVVQEHGAAEAEARVSLAVPEEQPGAEEQDRERRGQDRVDLLARVEAALGRAGAAGEERAVVAVEQVDLADRLAERAPVAERRDEQDRAGR